MSKIAWIGTGVMGTPMATHLAEAGHEMYLYNRTKAKAERAAENMPAGCKAKVFDSIKEAVKDVDYVFTMVGYPKDVEEVMLGSDAVFVSAKEGTVIIDMTTSSPKLAAKLYEEGKKRGLKLLDAPVSGGDKGAKEANLTIMVGGDEEVYKEVEPLFKLLGTTITYMGKAGNGQHTKAANQVSVAGTLLAAMETLTYAVRAGLDPHKVLEVVNGGAAASWQLENNGPKALASDFEPGFYIKHFIKDMKIADKEMEAKNTDLNVLSTVLDMFLEFTGSGHEDEATQAIIKYYLSDEELEGLNSEE